MPLTLAEERMKPQVADDDEFENVNPGKPRLSIPDGIYPARYVDKTITFMRWGEKLVITWKVFISVDFRDAEMRNEGYVFLQGYYNINRDEGNRLVFGPHSAYRKDWIAANNGRLPSLQVPCHCQCFRMAGSSSR